MKKIKKRFEYDWGNYTAGKLGLCGAWVNALWDLEGQPAFDLVLSDRAFAGSYRVNKVDPSYPGCVLYGFTDNSHGMWLALEDDLARWLYRHFKDRTFYAGIQIDA